MFVRLYGKDYRREMTAYSHRVGALAATATTTYLMGLTIEKEPLQMICLTVGALAGSLLPDADTPFSKIGRRYLIVLWPFYLFQFLVHLFLPRSGMDKTFGHRGMFHYPLFWTALWGVVMCGTYHIPRNSITSQILLWLVIGLGIGVLSHLLLDFVSGGIPILGPILKRRQKPPMKIKTGGVMEVVFSICLMGYSAYICATYLI